MALASNEIRLLDRLVADAGNRRCRSGTLSLDLIKLARLGGYLARSSDPPPGNTDIWRGLSRLTDIEIGLELGFEHCGSVECDERVVVYSQDRKPPKPSRHFASLASQGESLSRFAVPCRRPEDRDVNGGAISGQRGGVKVGQRGEDAPA
jgi:hypothetical protein